MTLGPLHPQAEALRRERVAAGFRPLHELSVAEAREAELLELPPALPEPVAETIELAVPGPAGKIAVRLYLPSAARRLPALVYFFGGGWVLGSLESVDRVCRRLANATPCAVASVAYRRAPEHPFPAGLEDCYAATYWLAEQADALGLDQGRLAVGGASSGGNLAAAVAQLTREREGPHVTFQLLVYPPLEYRAETASMREAFDPVFFGPQDIAWCWSHYLAEAANGESPLASPLRAPDLRGLPAALVITAEHDPLRDEGELYAARLVEAGVPAELLRFDGVVHGFFSWPDRFDAAAEAQAHAASMLRQALSPSSGSAWSGTAAGEARRVEGGSRRGTRRRSTAQAAAVEGAGQRAGEGGDPAGPGRCGPDKHELHDTSLARAHDNVTRFFTSERHGQPARHHFFSTTRSQAGPANLSNPTAVLHLAPSCRRLRIVADSSPILCDDGDDGE